MSVNEVDDLKRILVTGASGGLASVLLPNLKEMGHLITIARNTDVAVTHTLDLASKDDLNELVLREQPDIVVHLAALTDVDQCARHPRTAWEQNVRNTRNLVESVKDLSPHAHFVYVSTDMVYDGEGPQSELDLRPGNVYALTKLWGEEVASSLLNSLILRVNFFGVSKKSGTSLTSWLSRVCRSEEGATLFSDVLFNPLFATDLADAIIDLIKLEAKGTFNLGCRGNGVSKANFLRRIASELSLPTERLRDGSVSDVKLEAYRPRDMRMDVSHAERILRRKLSSLDETVSRFVKASINLKG